MDERFHDICSRIEAAAARAGRAPDAVKLVAVTKGRAVEDVRRLHALGQRDFGENRADALTSRMAALPDVHWHFIGNIQRNKVKLLGGCALVHSFDRPDLAASWPHGVPVLLQVDFTGAPQRGGLAPADVPAAMDACRAAGMDVRGLSTLPPREGDPRACFRKLRELRDSLGLRELSMGMSADFETAIEEGATMVRVGRALFQ
ncbi:MAG: YggS family pyridoxal phosphate enzyme [Candidatus Thermoplasmatota archaeon]